MYELRKLKRRYENRLQRAIKHRDELKEKESSLSEHGHWDLGYYTARVTLLEEIIADLSELQGISENNVSEKSEI